MSWPEQAKMSGAALKISQEPRSMSPAHLYLRNCPRFWLRTAIFCFRVFRLEFDYTLSMKSLTPSKTGSDLCHLGGLHSSTARQFQPMFIQSPSEHGEHRKQPHGRLESRQPPRCARGSPWDLAALKYCTLSWFASLREPQSSAQPFSSVSTYLDGTARAQPVSSKAEQAVLDRGHILGLAVMNGQSDLQETPGIALYRWVIWGPAT